MATYNIEIREFNGTSYDVLYPKTTINNVDGLSAKISQLDTMSIDITTMKDNISALDANKQNKLTFDTAPRANSNNPVTSNGILTALNAKQNTLTFDTVPTANSNNPVQSKGILTALNAKQNTLTFDSTPTASSNNPVTSNGILNALNTKQDKSTLGSLALKDKATLTNGDDVTGVLPVANGGTGNENGTVDRLTTARTIQTNLGNTSSASFDGSSNITPGITGTLGVPNGGTGASTAAGALQNLGVTISNVSISEGSTLASGSIYIYYE